MSQILVVAILASQWALESLWIRKISYVRTVFNSKTFISHQQLVKVMKQISKVFLCQDESRAQKPYPRSAKKSRIIGTLHGIYSKMAATLYGLM